MKQTGRRKLFSLLKHCWKSTKWIKSLKINGRQTALAKAKYVRAQSHYGIWSALLWLRFFCFAGRRPVVVRIRRSTWLIWITWWRNGGYILLELLTWQAHPVGEIPVPAYAKLAEFSPRRGIGEEEKQIWPGKFLKFIFSMLLKSWLYI